MEIRTILTPAEIATLPSRDLRGTVCVVFDVLRATSTILAALANGARQVFPARTVDEAFALRRDRFPGALLGGERNGVRIDGFDLGNSPGEYGPESVAGRDVITTTTNGTIALRAGERATAVLAAGLVNVDATAAWLGAHPGRFDTLLLVCAGTGTDFALEDGLAAGALATQMGRAGHHRMDDATRATEVLFDQRHEDLAEALRSSENGRRLSEIGLGADVEWCARLSVLDEVAVLQEGALRPARNLLATSKRHGNRDLPPAPILE